MDVASKKISITVLAEKCFEIIFEPEIKSGLFATGAYNLYGRSMRGSKDIKYPLSSSKVHALRAFVEDKFPHGVDKNNTWTDCCNAIHKKIGLLRKQKIKKYFKSNFHKFFSNNFSIRIYRKNPVYFPDTKSTSINWKGI